MAKFNLGDYLNQHVFKTNTMKQITGGIGSVFNKGLKLFDGITSNFLNMSKGLSSMINSPFIMPVLLCAGGIFIAIRLKVL